jgi:F-type H+-transporting ATPase subunit b
LTLSRFSSFLLILLCLAGALALPARALQTAPADASTTAKSAQSADQPEEGENVYRHSGTVKFLARWLHVDKETAAELFEYFNFAVLAIAILIALGKFLPKTFRANREDIQHRLVEARTATKEANERLSAIEQRLARLDEEIAAISKQAEKESADDEARIKASIEAERERIVKGVSRDIAAASSAAQRDLKRFVAGLAVDQASQRLALSEADDRSLVDEFAQNLGQRSRNGGQN